MENENGQTYYEAEMTVNGHGREVPIDKSGAVVEVEQQVPFESLPASVREGLQAKGARNNK
jgi:hypothetical protein